MWVEIRCAGCHAMSVSPKIHSGRIESVAVLLPFLDMEGSHDRDHRLRDGQFAQCLQSLRGGRASGRGDA
ncbi:hypothetical protein NITMOv2_0839 [Nitrospira moscoviensis]|uniref:Uncharacterized protein n=1 Tax=Nitrospira moscoviensis TaxID=42253 RepID=A0A0K2G8T5_NITMO|nr:hypothetical protein NITMOv2_0839 [Nitrospira moscoviensis]